MCSKVAWEEDARGNSGPREGESVAKTLSFSLLAGIPKKAPLILHVFVCVSVYVYV